MSILRLIIACAKLKPLTKLYQLYKVKSTSHLILLNILLSDTVAANTVDNHLITVNNYV